MVLSSCDRDKYRFSIFDAVLEITFRACRDVKETMG